MEMVAVQWAAALVKMDTTEQHVSSRIVQIHLSLWTLIRLMSNRGTIAPNMVNVQRLQKIPPVNVKMSIMGRIVVISNAKTIVPIPRRNNLESAQRTIQ